MARRTINEIAERVGVSVATVSRAINNAPGVGDEKRQQILAVAAEFEYYPHAIARRLQGQRTNTLCYAVDVSSRPAADLFFFKDFITVLADRCAHHGFELLLHPLRQNDGAIGELVALMRSGRADGIILSDARTDDPRVHHLLELKLPFVVFGRCPTAPGHAWVDVDGAAGVRSATRHLLGLGHRRIGLIGLPDAFSCAQDRARGYFEALEAAAVPVDPGWVATGLQTPDDLQLAMERLLVHNERPTAFVATSDMLALQAMSVAARFDLCAGRDYAITGFDNLPVTEYVSPPLTTLRQPLDRISDELIAMLLRLLAGESGEHQVLLEPELIVRGSSQGGVLKGRVAR